MIEAGKQQQLVAERELVKNHIGVKRAGELAREATLSDRTLGRQVNKQVGTEDPKIIELSSRESVSSLVTLLEEECEPTAE